MRRLVATAVVLAVLIVLLASAVVRIPIVAGATLIAAGAVLAADLAHATSAWAALTVDLRRSDILWRVSWPFNEHWSKIFTRFIGVGLSALGVVLIVVGR